MVDTPRLVIAAPASGHGKTTVATGLLAAFAARGLTVAGFKVGPDYIDPGYHALASSRPGRNLDPVLVGEERIAPLFAHGVTGADLAIIEGVMALYDGRTGAGDFGSTAHVARLLDAPVVLVVDAAAQGRSVAALVHGFRSFPPGTRIAGVVLNRVGSQRHADLLREALEEVGTPVLGVLRRADTVAAPARHLGLVPVVERRAEAQASVAALADLIAASVHLAAVLASRSRRRRCRPRRGRRGRPRRRPAGRWSPSRVVRRSASPTPKPLNYSPAPAPRWPWWIRCVTRRCAPRWRHWPPAAHRSPPSAPGCCGCAAASTAPRCAGSSTSKRP